MSDNDYPILIEHTSNNYEEQHLINEPQKLSQLVNEIFNNEHSDNELFVCKRYIFDSFMKYQYGEIRHIPLRQFLAVA